MMDTLSTVGVLGASGYVGGELLRLLAAHPGVEVAAIGARSDAGREVAAVHPHLPSLAGRRFEALAPGALAGRAEVVLLALPHEESARLAPELLEAGARVIDLSGAFRLPAADYPRWYGFAHPAPAWLEKAVYGSPETSASEIADAQLVANPGCYPTAALLALAPLARAGLLEGRMVIDAKSGVSGAGRAPTEATHFAGTDGSVRPYAVPGHRHVPEIERGLGGAPVVFAPHLVPTVRGILATCYAAARGSRDDLAEALEAAYAESPFVRVLPAGSLPDTKRVAGTNRAEVAVAVDRGTAIAIAAIDNLVKGAAGQAVQNLNLMLGLDEAAGLEAAAVYP